MSVLTQDEPHQAADEARSATPAAPVGREAPAEREILHVASQDTPAPSAEAAPAAPVARAPGSVPEKAKPAPGQARPASGEARLPPLVDVEEEPPPQRFRHFLRSLGKTAATLLILGLAVLAGLLIWDYYVTAPWTRDGRIRVQVAAIAPQVSGQITDLKVRDNQFVHKGDVLYVIDQFDFKRTLETAKATLKMKAADLQVKKVQAERRQHLSDLATTPEEQQQYVGNATQAQAAFESAQQDVDQANVNLQRTSVESPVNGYVTNLLMRVGDYAREGTTNISVIDADSYWVDGYFEETKMAHVCVGDTAEAQLMGYRAPILGKVTTVTRGISVSDAAPSTQGLPNVDPVYTWVRLAQRVPVRIGITHVPPGVPLVSGMTATVTIRDPAQPDGQPWYQQRWYSLRDRISDIVYRPQPHSRCVPVTGPDKGVNDTIQDYEIPPAQTPGEINPGLAPGLTAQPQPDR